MQTPESPLGPHCHCFDTDLLQQVIAVEVEAAVRRVCRERGIECASIDQHAWVETIVGHIRKKLGRASDLHTLLPSEVDMQMEREIGVLIDRVIRDSRPSDTGAMIMPIHGLCLLPRHAGVLLRRIFKKHIE